MDGGPGEEKSMKLNLAAVPAPETGVVGRILESEQPGQTEAVLVLPGRGQVKVLNEVGARIWALVDGACSVQAIAAILSAEYAVDPAEAERDTLAFVEDMLRQGVFRLVDAPAAETSH
jgi:hypothetical protein